MDGDPKHRADAEAEHASRGERKVGPEQGHRCGAAQEPVGGVRLVPSVGQDCCTR